MSHYFQHQKSFSKPFHHAELHDRSKHTKAISVKSDATPGDVFFLSQILLKKERISETEIYHKTVYKVDVEETL